MRSALIRHSLLIVTLLWLVPPATARPCNEFISLNDGFAGSPILGLADRNRYAEIFRLQKAGKWGEADTQIEQLSNRLLMGHVLAQRYLHPTKYRSRFDELAKWLETYPDHPQAQRIYQLARKRKTGSQVALVKPIDKPNSLSEPLPPPTAYRSALKLSHKQYELKRRMQRKIRRYLAKTYRTKTEQLLQDERLTHLFDRYELDQAYADLAAAWLYYGDAERALRLASEVAERSGKNIPVVHWTAGLAAWKLGHSRYAAQHFTRLALSDKASNWNRAAGAYWAARAFYKEVNLAGADRWLERAGQFPETFYGLLARQRLGKQPFLSFQRETSEPVVGASLITYPEGRRAIAFLEIGARARAEEELLWFDNWQDVGLPSQLAALADYAQMPQLGFQLVEKMRAARTTLPKEISLETIAYPLIPWRPQSGFKIDRAVLLAFIRQESSFNPSAKSHDGARGLMQLMPRTASALVRATGIAMKGERTLYVPSLNLEFGQSYLMRLLNSRHVQGDLLRLAVAYNAGPGNLAAWNQQMGPQEDPLLFVETLPSRETRLFVERVMTNLWIYRLRLGQAVPSLEDLAAGEWPQYLAQDPLESQLVSSEPGKSR